ncbi:Monothiol glutaredoxin-S5 [Cocos nucifera]|uniref:Monothiol glutaredoxin-S5 n=1 Tax=Cocos nucifera TaxID=13894 RepID=A0A8K0IAQ3_COCNU|nr:Monothiol glutaredoxin-S5 [Cocos nucifera]
MQKAIPYSSGRTWFAPTAASNSIVHMTDNDRPSLDGPSTSSSWSEGSGRMRRLVAENPVLVVGRQGCCLCHVVKRLLQGLGVNPTVCEVAEDAESALVEELAEIAGGGGGGGGGSGGRVQQQLLFPAVFIGGRLVGGLDRLMAVHISGDLVPILKEAGALWL